MPEAAPVVGDTATKARLGADLAGNLDTALDVIGIVRAERLGVGDAPTVGCRLACACAFGALALISNRSTKYAFLGRKRDSWRHEKRKDKEAGN